MMVTACTEGLQAVFPTGEHGVTQFQFISVYFLYSTFYN